LDHPLLLVSQLHVGRVRHELATVAKKLTEN
jgi:hypothetical protein